MKSDENYKMKSEAGKAFEKYISEVVARSTVTIPDYPDRDELAKLAWEEGWDSLLRSLDFGNDIIPPYKMEDLIRVRDYQLTLINSHSVVDSWLDKKRAKDNDK